MPGSNLLEKLPSVTQRIAGAEVLPGSSARAFLEETKVHEWADAALMVLATQLDGLKWMRRFREARRLERKKCERRGRATREKWQSSNELTLTSIVLQVSQEQIQQKTFAGSVSSHH